MTTTISDVDVLRDAEINAYELLEQPTLPTLQSMPVVSAPDDGPATGQQRRPEGDDVPPVARAV